MKIKAPENMSSAEKIAFYDCEENLPYYQYGTNGGWQKYKNNPVFGGGEAGTCFDVSLLLEKNENGENMFPSFWKKTRMERTGYLRCGFPGEPIKGLDIQRAGMGYTGKILRSSCLHCRILCGKQMK